jgi:5-methylcytosine-specific restriction endonuclease McrA
MTLGRPIKDLTGQRFGRLSVLYAHAARSRRGATHWICVCDCGNRTRSRSDTLQNGRAASCGCLAKERAADRIREVGFLNKDDLTGSRFGRLLVVAEAPRGESGRTRWECLCDCGRTRTVWSSNLTTRKTQSCGCLDRERKVTHGLSHTAGYKAAGCSKRRARKAGAGGTFTEQQIRELYALQGERCRYCCKQLAYQEIHRDHRMPIALGGSSDIANIQILCAACNLSKGAQHPDEYESALRRLTFA